MRLFNKLIISSSLCIVVLAVAVCSHSLVSLKNAHSYTLQRSTESLAVQLAAGLSAVLGSGNPSSLNRACEGIMSQGQLLRLRLLASNKEPILELGNSAPTPPAAGFFALPDPLVSAQIETGSASPVTLEITRDASLYRAHLRQKLIEQLVFVSIVLLLVFAAAWLTIKKVLRPLYSLERQINALENEEFIELPSVPEVPELRGLVRGMNHVIRRINDNYQRQLEQVTQLRKDASSDPVTGLDNRQEFDRRLSAWVASERGESPGVLILLQVGSMSQYNDRHGREAGDKLLVDISRVMQNLLIKWPEAFAAKRTGSDFSIFIPGLLEEEAGACLADMRKALTSLQRATDEKMLVWLGCASARSVRSISRMLSAADAALRLAQTSGESDWAVYPVDDLMLDVRPAGEWQSFLAMLIEQNRLLLHFQPIVGRDKEILGSEVYSRVDDGGSLIKAGMFWPLAERYGLVAELDRQVIDKALLTLGSEPELCLSVNLSTGSMLDPEFVDWLLSSFASRALQSRRLTLELNEQLLAMENFDFVGFQKRVRKTGVALAIEHFGVSPSALGFLPSAAFAYVKVDRRYIAGIEDDRDNQFYLQTLVQIARTCGVRIIADGIENDLQWQTLRKLGFDGGQGYLFGMPAASPAVE